MNEEVVIVRAKGEGGIQDPRSGAYISSQVDSVAPLTPYLENLINHEQVELKEKLGSSNFLTYIELVREKNGDEAQALDEYRKRLKDLPNPPPAVVVDESGSDTTRVDAEETSRPRGGPRRTDKPND